MTASKIMLPSMSHSQSLILNNSNKATTRNFKETFDESQFEIGRNGSRNNKNDNKPKM